MLRRWAGRAAALVPLTAAGTVGLCELVERADDAEKPTQAKHQLLALRNAATRLDGDQEQEQEPEAWLNAEKPQFPYLLAISAGDDPGAVIDGVLHGALVIGARDWSASAMAMQLSAPLSALGQVVREVTSRWKEFKLALHAADIPNAFDSRVSADDIARRAIISALKQIRAEEVEEEKEEKETGIDTSDGNNAPVAEASVRARPFVFVLNNFDELDDRQAEKWLQWTNEVTASGLAHVVAPTRRAVTPERVQWLQERHRANHKEGEFVAILLRVAKDAVDRSTAEDKAHRVAAALGFELHGSSRDGSDQFASEVVDDEDSRGDEAKIIARATGNWWADIRDVCTRLAHSGLLDVKDKEERLGVIYAVCDEFIEDTSKILASQALALDTDLGALLRLRAAISNATSSPNAESDSIDLASAQDRALSSLEAWRCLEIMTGLQSAGGGGRASVMGSVQELVTRGERPLNCVHPVDALLAFNSRPEGERKFLALIDDGVLLLRPKMEVEIGVVPCETTALLSSCWVEVRPAIKMAFEKLWRNDDYFMTVQALERLSTTLHLRNEIHIFEQEISDRQRALDNMQGEFKLRQFALSKAERAQRKAEIALLQMELDAKHVYLDKLRSLLS